jgi:hypothetical protein
MDNWFVDYIDWPGKNKIVRVSETGAAGLAEGAEELAGELSGLVEWACGKCAGEVDAWASEEHRKQGDCFWATEGDYSLNACIARFDDNKSIFMRRPFVRVLAGYKTP